jgi:glycosyltransferase involved in cell wall biosynthesis
MGKPKISVLLSSYMHERFIGRSIESVLDQTFKDIELIIVDDCSTDNSKDIINSYKDPRIRAFFLDSNQGMGVAFNYAIKPK